MDTNNTGLGLRFFSDSHTIDLTAFKFRSTEMVDKKMLRVRQVEIRGEGRILHLLLLVKCRLQIFAHYQQRQAKLLCI